MKLQILRGIKTEGNREVSFRKATTAIGCFYKHKYGNQSPCKLTLEISVGISVA